MTKKLTTKQFLNKVKKLIKIQVTTWVNFQYYVTNATSDWIAAYVPELKRIYLKGKQPKLVVFHELVHFIRDYTSSTSLDLSSYKTVLFEELVAYEAGYRLCKALGCSTKCQVYYKGWGSCQRQSKGLITEEDQKLIKTEAKKAVKELVRLATK